METFPKAKILNSYGQTESGLITTYQRYQCDTKECREKLLKQSCGKPAQGVSLKVVDPTTEEMLGPHQRGEIMVCGRYLMNNYYGVSSTTSFDADGWFKSGDIGYYDEDDYIYIVDRVREVIKYKYNSMSPSFLEDILATHPSVKQVIVTGIPHEEDGDHPIAFIVPEKNVKINPDEIHKFYNKKVDDKMRLRGGIKIIDRIPTTETGKPVRNLLKDMVLIGKL